MEATLLTVGLVCLVAAVVGGGLKILGNEVPVLQSVQRQAILGMVGAVLIGAALWARAPSSGEVSNTAQTSDEHGVLASPAPKVEAEGTPGPTPMPASNLNSAQEAADLKTPDGSDFRNPTQEAQYRLIALGFDVGYPDGYEGPKFTASMEAFQRQHNLPVSGTSDAATLDLLRARSRKAFLVLQAGTDGQPTDYQKRWFPDLRD